ncbi:odorant receptor 13a-like [Vespa crabro]|uniref:odorant receptor 13a-like n=1 Tax=Vespa crabro TaxID=7445 RepID=UPI001F02E394|nr:odorant receptor 13a-like [Vespa crabro]
MNFWTVRKKTISFDKSRKGIIDFRNHGDIFGSIFVLKIVTLGFTNTMKAITLCKRLLGFSGVWPLEIRDSLFLPLLFYGFITNSTSEYKLPYKIKPLLKPYDAKTYAFGCIHEFLRILMIISANSGTDCLLASTGFHLTGQLAILNCRAKEILKETDVSQQGIHKIILRHHRLIRLADILEDSFSVVICQQLLGTTIQICISSYQILSSLAVLEGIGIIIFGLHIFVLLSTLFTYCYIGDCLIEESTNLCLALYHCDWYELSTIDMKSIYICMIRSRKPLQLTCAKFCVISLRTFTIVMKTSMAYLSVLRTFMETKL